MEQWKQWKQQHRKDLNKAQSKLWTGRKVDQFTCEQWREAEFSKRTQNKQIVKQSLSGGRGAHLFFLCSSWWSGWRTRGWTSPASAPGTPLKPEPPRRLYPQVIGSSRHIPGTRPTSPEARGSLWEQRKQTFRKRCWRDPRILLSEIIAPIVRDAHHCCYAGRWVLICTCSKFRGKTMTLSFSCHFP